MKLSTSLTTLAVCIASSIASYAGSDKAAPISIASPQDSWQFDIAPYAWLAGIEGTTALPGLPAAEIDVPFEDIWDNLDFAGFLALKAQKGNIRTFIDMQYIKLGAEADLIGPLTADIDVEQFRLELGAGYVVYETPSTTIYPYLGVMYNYVKDTITFPRGRGIEASDGWFDPAVGISVIHQINDRWNTNFTAEYGGFGVSSDSTWQAIAVVGYQFSQRWSGLLGYRYQSIDYENDGFIYDTDTSGPIIGFNYSF